MFSSWGSEVLIPVMLSLVGCLLQYLRQRKELVERTEVILDMAIQIGSAMEYLEKSGFIHRDLVIKVGFVCTESHLYLT